MSYFSVLHGGEVRTRCARHHTVDRAYSDGELVAVLVQSEPRPAHRDGWTGLIQSLRSEPQSIAIYSGVTLGVPWSRIVSLPESLTGTVYGLLGVMPEPTVNRNQEPAAEPLPVDCPASDYVSEFRAIAAKLATRNVWKIARQCPHVDADDLANDAVVLLLDDPQRYATEPLEHGASAAVNDAVRNAQGGEARRRTRLSAIVGDEFPEPVQPEPLDYQTEADALAVLVGRGLAIHAALVANQLTVEVSAEAVGASPRTIARRRAEVSNRLYSLAFDNLALSDR